MFNLFKRKKYSGTINARGLQCNFLLTNKGAVVRTNSDYCGEHESFKSVLPFIETREELLANIRSIFGDNAEIILA